MAAVQVDVLNHVLCLQVRLFACRERLIAATDEEALHDFRIALRQLRSLLRPLRDLALCGELAEAAAQFGSLSGPVRDLEVLQAYLRKQGLTQAADARQRRLATGYAGLIKSHQLVNLFSILDQWPQAWRESGCADQPNKLNKRVLKQMEKDRKRLFLALDDPLHDRHRLRLLIKRLRYSMDAYALQSGASLETQALLKRAQSALGDWHDHLQWLLRAEIEADLQPCVEAWTQAMQQAEKRADEALGQLAAAPVFSA